MTFASTTRPKPTLGARLSIGHDPLAPRRLRAVRPAAPFALTAALDARWRRCRARCIPTASPPQGAAAQRVAMQWAVRVNEAYQRLKDPLAARRLPVRAARRADRRPRATPRCRRLPDAADGVARGARRGAVAGRGRRAVRRGRGRARRDAESRCRRRSTTHATRPARRRRHGARAHVRRRFHAATSTARSTRWNNKQRHGTAADLRTRPGARSAPAPHRRGHRPRHDALAGGRGAPRRGRVPARRRRAA